MTEPKLVTLSTLAGGAADELFADAMRKVVENIQDLNTAPTVARKIVLEFIVTADDERHVGAVEVRCATKLAGVKGVSAPVYFGRHQGVAAVVEAPRQEDMFTDTVGKPRLVPPAAGAEGDA